MSSRSIAVNITAVTSPISSDAFLGMSFNLTNFWIIFGSGRWILFVEELPSFAVLELLKTTCTFTGPEVRSTEAINWVYISFSSSIDCCQNTSSRSLEARRDLAITSRYIASIRLLLPCPLATSIKVIPGLKLRLRLS